MAAYRDEKRVGSDGTNFHKKDRSKTFDKDSKDFDSGRIGRLDEDTMGYYRRVSEAITEGFPDKSEQGKFTK